MNRIVTFLVTTSLITLLAYPGTAPSLNVAGTVRVNALTVAGGGGGGGCTVNSGNVFNECFENTGYELTWTEVAGSPDENSALPSSFARLGSEAYRVTWSADTEYSRKDEGTAVTSGTRWFRIYLYIASEGLNNANGDPLEILSAWETTDTSDTDQRAFVVWLIDDGGTYTIKARGDSVATLDAGISLNAWYRIEVEWVRGTTSAVKVYNSSDTQVGTTQTFTAGPLADWRYTVIGQYSTVTGASADYYLDGLGVSSTAYLGQ